MPEPEPVPEPVPPPPRECRCRRSGSNASSRACRAQRRLHLGMGGGRGRGGPGAGGGGACPLLAVESSAFPVPRPLAVSEDERRAAPGDPSAAPASNSAAYRAGEEGRARPRPLISAGGGGAGAGPERFHWSSSGPSRPRTRQDPSQKRVSGLLLQPGVSRGNGGGAGLRHLAPPSTPGRNAPPPDSRPLAFPRLRNLMGG